MNSLIKCIYVYSYARTHKHTCCTHFCWLLFSVLMMLWGCPPLKCSHFTEREAALQRHVVDCLQWHSDYEAKQKSQTNSCIMKSHAPSRRLSCLSRYQCVSRAGQRRKSQAALEVPKPLALNKSPNYAHSWTGFWNLLNIPFPSSSLKFPFKQHLGKDTLISWGLTLFSQ